MLKVLHRGVEANRDCDFVQALVNNFVKNHFEIIMDDPELTEQMSEMKKVTEEKYERLQHLLNSNLCMTSYFAAIDHF
jgi:hypothetical protein